MEIEELKNKKELLRKEIIESIQRFTEHTGIHPSEIDIRIRTSYFSGVRKDYLESVEIRVDV